MAKWEERDPRWIVEERPDAKNVNGWHWEEKNCSEWAHERLKKHFVAISGERDGVSYKVTGTDKCTGELNWYNRKGKRFILFELCICVSWEAEKGGEKWKGSLEAEDVPQDEESKANWKIKVKEGKSDSDLSNSLKKALVEEVVKKIRTMMDELFKLQEEKIPKVGNEGKKVELGEVKSKEEKKEQPKTELKLEYTFQANPSDLFDCLLNQQRVCMYTRSAAQIEAKVGSSFSLYGGAILGEILEVEKDSKIMMKWKLKDWNSFSTVSFSLRKDNGTKLTLLQKGIPANDFERTKSGWNNYYWTPIRAVFGYNFESK